MKRGVAAWTQRILFAVGFITLGFCGADWLNSRFQQAQGNRELDSLLSNRIAPSGPATPIADGGLIGKVEIPRLHLSAIAFQGIENSVLDHGVGHLNNSALPGQPGNVVFAAHRDTFFRDLRNIRKGDIVNVITEAGVHAYSVDSTQVVAPTDIGVTDPTVKPTLTLITCYPFYYVGHAPKRFIVRASDIPSVPEPAPVVARATGERATGERATGERATGERATGERGNDLTYVFRASSKFFQMHVPSAAPPNRRYGVPRFEFRWVTPRA